MRRRQSGHERNRWGRVGSSTDIISELDSRVSHGERLYDSRVSRGERPYDSSDIL